MPFAVDRSADSGLIEQVTDGIRRAIVCGKYRPGDILPKLEEFAAGLGVSMNVVRAASSRLVKEGLVRVRRHIGAIVQPPGRKTRRGHVLMVVPDGNRGVFTALLVGEARAVLSARDYLFSEVTVCKARNGRYDTVLLEMELHETVDLAILLYNRPPIERVLASSGVPFMVIGDRASSAPNFAGLVRMRLDAAVGDVVAQCLRCGVRRALVVCAWSGGKKAVERFRAAGVEANEWRIGSNALYDAVEEVQREGLEAFADRFRREGRAWLPDLLFFADDDFLAAGCLMALLAEGVKVPEDVCVVTLANKGVGPVFTKPLARLEVDPGGYGRSLADFAYDILNGKKPPRKMETLTTYVPGETFPEK